MAASTVHTLTDYAEQVLLVSGDALATTDSGCPDRVFISPDAPVFDCCPFVNVYVSALREETTSPLSPTETALRTKFGSVILATFVISAVRCAANPMSIDNMPTAAAITASAAEVQQDGWALWNGIRDAQQNGLLFDGCIGLHFDGGVPIPEQGGCVGWVFSLRASIPGIPNLL